MPYEYTLQIVDAGSDPNPDERHDVLGNVGDERVWCVGDGGGCHGDCGGRFHDPGQPGAPISMVGGFTW